MADDLKKLLIETPVDKLVILAKQKRGITVQEAARLLDATEQQVEDWTRVLEEHGMLKLEFPVAGPPRIAPVAIPQARLVKKVEEFRQRRAEIEMLAKSYSEKGESDRQISLRFVPVEHELYSRLKDAEDGIKSLDTLKGMEKKMESDISEFEKEKDKIIEESSELEKRTSELMKKIDYVKASSQDLASDIGDVLSDMESRGKNAKILGAEQKNIEGELAALNKEIRMVSALAGGRKETFAKKLSRLFSVKKRARKADRKQDTESEKARIQPSERKVAEKQPSSERKRIERLISPKRKKNRKRIHKNKARRANAFRKGKRKGANRKNQKVRRKSRK